MKNSKDRILTTHAGSLSRPADLIAMRTFANRRDWQKFSEFYQDPESSSGLVGSAARRPTRRPVCISAIKYIGDSAIAADIANLKTAMSAAGVEEAFMCSVGPGSF